MRATPVSVVSLKADQQASGDELFWRKEPKDSYSSGAPTIEAMARIFPRAPE
jgi:hypothetical protein